MSDLKRIRQEERNVLASIQREYISEGKKIYIKTHVNHHERFNYLEMKMDALFEIMNGHNVEYPFGSFLDEMIRRAATK